MHATINYVRENRRFLMRVRALNRVKFLKVSSFLRLLRWLVVTDLQPLAIYLRSH